MKRLLLAAALAALVVAAPWPLAETPANATALTTSAVTRVYVEPTAGYGFFSQAINSAHRDIDLSMYEFSDPLIEAQLVARARAGVRVRVLLNSTYYGREDNAAAAAVLSRGGVHVSWAPSGQIFHAKYLVIDDSRVFIGTGNLQRYYYSSTRDFWVLDQSRADVEAVEATFNGDVEHVSRPPLVSGGLVWSPGSASTLVGLIASAHRTLLIENEEMDEYSIEDALVAAAARGVRVTVVMTDSTQYLTALTYLARHGVRVDLLSSSQVYIHAKVICADCAATSGTLFVGSENFSTSSLEYNRELGLVTASALAVRSIWTTVSSDAAEGTRLAP